jgi:hypothetical protein
LNSKSHWLSFPIVKAPSPFDRDKFINLRISTEFVEKNAFIKRRTPVFAVWTHVVGQPPPINNIAREFNRVPPPALSTLADAHACFMGVNRPYHDDDTGSEVAVYILKPTHTLKYDPDMVCAAKACEAPIKSVLTVQVRFDQACKDEVNDIHGMVTRLEFVPPDVGNASLPKGFSGRYSKRLW